MGGYSKRKKKPTQLIRRLARSSQCLLQSVPHQLLWKTLEAHHVPRVVIEVLQEYLNGFVMRFSTKECITGWIPLQISMGCAISPSLFVLAMQIVLNAVGAGIHEAREGRGVYMPSIKAFMDDTTIILNRKQIVQRVHDKLNDLLRWCCLVLKPAKSRSLSLTRKREGKVRRDVHFTVGGQRISTVSEEPVKSLGR